MSLVTTLLTVVSGSGAQTFTSISAGSITDTGLTASRAVVTDASKVLSSSATTATELGYVNGVTSAIQTQLDAKLDEGNLSVSGNTISATNANGDVVITANALGNVEIGANSTHASRLRFKEDTDNGVNYVTIGAPASLAGDTDYDLPGTAPTGNGALLSATTAGAMSWTLTPTLTTLAFSPSTGGIIGTATNDNADAGNVGEFVSSTIAAASAVSLTDSTPANITSISLTAGDWDVGGNAFWKLTGVSTIAYVWISTTTASLPDVSLITGQLTTGAGTWVGSACAPVRISISGTTTVYLSTQSAFSTGTCTACGGIFARRVR